MPVLSFSDTCANLEAVVDRVVADRDPTVIARPGAEAAVMVALSDWSAIEETLHLLSSPNNAFRLRDAIRQLDASEGTAQDLLTP